MKKSKMFKIIAALGLTVVFLAACSPAQTTPDVQPPGENGASTDITIGVVLVDMVNQFFVDLMEGGNLAAADYGVTVIWQSADGNFDNQIALVENFIAQGVDIIISDPLDSVGLTPVKEQAAAAGIPTITMAGYVDVPTNFTTVYNDLENTRITAELIGHTIGGEGTVALLYGNRGNLVSDLRREGFHLGMEQFPNITVIEQPMNWDPPTGMQVAQDLLAAHPNLAAIHSVSDAVTLAVHQAVILAGREGDIIITSYDGNPDGITQVENGVYLSNVLTGARKTGYWNIHLAIELALGYLPTERIMNMDTHFIVNEETYDLLRSIAPDISIITPAEAREIAEAFRDEIFDPNLMN